jgi:hypothetical protein
LSSNSTRLRWENNIKIELKKVEEGGVGGWTGLSWLGIKTGGGHINK